MAIRGPLRLRRRRHWSADADVERLSRFSGTTIDHPPMFGGGFDVARVALRMQTVAWGYPAVVEEFEAFAIDSAHTATSAAVANGSEQQARSGDGAQRWCTLTVSLPSAVPCVVVDHRWADGRPGVPGAPVAERTEDLEFDIDYLVSTKEPGTVARILTVEARTALLERPVQRMAFTGSALLLRSFDGTPADPEVIRMLRSLAAEVLSTTRACRSAIDPDGPAVPFPRGWHRDATRS